MSIKELQLTFTLTNDYITRVKISDCEGRWITTTNMEVVDNKLQKSWYHRLAGGVGLPLF
jgi:hypothetical protein